MRPTTYFVDLLVAEFGINLFDVLDLSQH